VTFFTNISFKICDGVTKQTVLITC